MIWVHSLKNTAAVQICEVQGLAPLRTDMQNSILSTRLGSFCCATIASLVFALRPVYQLAPVTQHQANLSPPSHACCPAPPVQPGSPGYPWPLTLGLLSVPASSCPPGERELSGVLLGSACRCPSTLPSVLAAWPWALVVPSRFFRVCICEMGTTRGILPSFLAGRVSWILEKAPSVTTLDSLLGQLYWSLAAVATVNPNLSIFTLSVAKKKKYT